MEILVDFIKLLLEVPSGMRPGKGEEMSVFYSISFCITWLWILILIFLQWKCNIFYSYLNKNIFFIAGFVLCGRDGYVWNGTPATIITIK